MDNGNKCELTHEHGVMNIRRLPSIIHPFSDSAAAAAAVVVFISIIIIIRESNLCFRNGLSNAYGRHELVPIIYSSASRHYHSFIPSLDKIDTMSSSDSFYSASSSSSSSLCS